MSKKLSQTLNFVELHIAHAQTLPRRAFVGTHTPAVVTLVIRLCKRKLSVLFGLLNLVVTVQWNCRRTCRQDLPVQTKSSIIRIISLYENWKCGYKKFPGRPCTYGAWRTIIEGSHARVVLKRRSLDAVWNLEFLKQVQSSLHKRLQI